MQGLEVSANAQPYLDMEEEYVAKFFKTYPIVIERGERIYLYDVDGKKYYDMLAGPGAVNQGHCHPKIVDAMMK